MTHSINKAIHPKAKSGSTPHTPILHLNKQPSKSPSSPTCAEVIYSVFRSSSPKQQDDTCLAGRCITSNNSPVILLRFSTRLPPQIATQRLSPASIVIPSGTPSVIVKSTFRSLIDALSSS